MKVNILHKTMEKGYEVNSSDYIPRKGDKIDLGFNPPCEVVEVLWRPLDNPYECLVIVD